MAGPNNLTHLFGLDKTQTKFGHFKTFTLSPSVAIAFKQPWDGRPAEFLDKSGCHVVCCDIGRHINRADVVLVFNIFMHACEEKERFLQFLGRVSSEHQIIATNRKSSHQPTYL